MNGQVSFKEDMQYYDVFLSYCHADNKTAMMLKSAIQSLGYSVFYDQDSLEGSSNWKVSIAKCIENSKVLVFFQTANSVASRWCQREVNIADDAGKQILPVAFRRDQNNLPSSEELKLALSSLQTSFISDSPTVSDLKNELKTALEEKFGISQVKVERLSLTDFILSATENINTKYRSLFEYTEADDISADINDYQISLKWRLKLGDNSANLVIALNKFSKRPLCYANCSQKNSCPFYAEKDCKEYSLEAFLEFIDKSRKSMIHDVLDSLLGKAFNKCRHGWCGNAQSIKYFFREVILPGKEVDEINDFNAVLLLINEAVTFYDTIFGKLEKYMKYTHDICEIFRKKELVLSYLNSSGSSWEHNGEVRSDAKIHFFKKDSVYYGCELNKQLGTLFSVTIKYPEALQIRLLAFEEQKIRIRVIRFEKDKKVEQKHDFMLADFENIESVDERKKVIAEAVLKKVNDIFNREAKDPVSTLPESIHGKLRDFIQTNSFLSWNITQYGPNTAVATGVFRSKEKNSDEMKEFSQLRFSIQIAYHTAKETVDLSQHISSDFPGADENSLSEITGFSVWDEKGKGIDYLKDFFAATSKELSSVHDNIYQIYKALANLDKILCAWKKNKAATVLFIDNTQNDYLDAYKDNETCWEYYLSPGFRLCRKLRKQNGKEYPVMFCIRFESSGAKNAAIGWCADHSFNNLSSREKELFWRYVILQFPPELKENFAYRNNAIYLAENPEKDISQRKIKVFPTVADMEQIIRSWMDAHLIEQMFSKFEQAVKDFNIINFS